MNIAQQSWPKSCRLSYSQEVLARENILSLAASAGSIGRCWVSLLDVNVYEHFIVNKTLWTHELLLQVQEELVILHFKPVRGQVPTSRFVIFHSGDHVVSSLKTRRQIQALSGSGVFTTMGKCPGPFRQVGWGGGGGGAGSSCRRQDMMYAADSSVFLLVAYWHRRQKLSNPANHSRLTSLFGAFYMYSISIPPETLVFFWGYSFFFPLLSLSSVRIIKNSNHSLTCFFLTDILL